MDHEDDEPGTTWNARARKDKPDWMSPRMAWRAIQSALPREAIISSDIGNNCAIGNAYPTFEAGRKYLAPGLFGPCGYGLPSIIGAKIGCPDVPVVGFAGDGAFGIAVTELTAIGRPEWPAITMVVFRNYQWGAEKRNSTLWYDDNFVGTELDNDVTYAGIARACGLQGVQARSMDELRAALAKAGGPVIVFAHQRLDMDKAHAVRNAAEVRALLEKSGKVLAVFQGHSHKNDYQQIAGIHYTTLVAMVEGSGMENNGYSMLDIMADGSLRLNVFRRQVNRTLNPG